MPIARPTTNVTKLATCAARRTLSADLTVAPHFRNSRPGKEIRRGQSGHDGRRVGGHALTRQCSPDGGDSRQFRVADPGPPEPQERFAVAGQQPAQRGHQRGCLRPGVGGGDHLDAPRARGSQQVGDFDRGGVPHVAAGDQRDDPTVPEGLGMRASSDRMGSEGDRYHTWYASTTNSSSSCSAPKPLGGSASCTSASGSTTRGEHSEELAE